ncbi:MAG: DUF2249 domain-containing protein [Gammaproteobacteria bacterium]|nr:DUF2249 domain-containing protein [Gammaproteobacteria bacterium]
MSNEVVLDVSELEPPEPLVLTLEAAEKLKPGQYLRMLHRREPCMLYGNLDDNHFKYYQRKGTTSAVEVFIWSEQDEEAAAAVLAIINTSNTTTD